MRYQGKSGPLRVQVYAGTYVVLMAMDMDEAARVGLRGFAIKRGVQGKPPTWLQGIKYFESLVPNPGKGDSYSSRSHPFQTFLWSDYSADPDTSYDFTIVALYGPLDRLEERHTVSFRISTEKDDDRKHGVWFNRGVLTSHALATQFHNKRLTDEMTNAVSEDGRLLDPEAQWLSRGLAEACLKFINSTGPGEGLRVCAYEFTYVPILAALKRAIVRGADVQIIYHDAQRNTKAVAAAELPAQVLTLRTRPPIPHNKFIVKLVHGQPKQVWTGSTNFTNTGFLGQTNVGHLITDDTTAATYLAYWTVLARNPARTEALQNTVSLTPNPKNVLASRSITAFFSPRIAESMLDWYGLRITNAASLAMLTIPFNVAKPILSGLSLQRAAMRLVILEDIPSPEVKAAERLNRGKLAFTNGSILGKSFVKYKTGIGGAKVAPVPNSDLDRWFIEEEVPRDTTSGHVFFVHSKVLIIDPLSDDPLVCTGSANFSKNSLINNDENMLLIRGETRVADIYVTELDRIFRHFRAREVLNRTSRPGGPNPLALATTDEWIGANFKEGTYKNNRRLMFFPGSSAAKAWFVAAALDKDPFDDETEREANARAERNRHARERNAHKKKAPTKKVAKKTTKKAAKKKAAKKKQAATRHARKKTARRKK